MGPQPGCSAPAWASLNGRARRQGVHVPGRVRGTARAGRSRAHRVDGTHLAIPEIQDVFVLPERRRQGIASQLTQTAEVERKRGWDSISLSVSQEGNEFARRLYAKLGYVEAPTDPVRVSGVIVLRGQPFEVDDTLVYLMKRL